MNIDHLKLFVRLAITNNISLAGHELGLSPAVASSYINKLEAGLGVRLVHRTTRKVSLTEDGSAFLPHAEEVLSSVEAARASVGVGNASPRGTLRVTAPASFGRMHLMPAVKDFLARYPDLTLDFRFTDTIVDLVEGGFDIAIRNAELQDSTLIARQLAPDKRIVCASPDYLKQFGEPSSPHDLQYHQCINLIGLESWVFDTTDGHLTVKTKGSFRTDNGEAVRDACVAGLGIAINSTWSVYQHLRRGELVQILGDYPLVSDTAIWAVYPSSRLLAPKVRVFIDYFVNCYGNPPYWDQQREDQLSAEVEAALEVIGGKWKGIILYHLLSKTICFDELHRLMPEITQRMLTRQLRELEENNLISRKVYPEVPPNVEYSMTGCGMALAPVIHALQVWGSQYLEKTSDQAKQRCR